MSHDMNNLTCPHRNNPYANCTCDEQRLFNHTSALNEHAEALRHADNDKDTRIRELESDLASVRAENEALKHDITALKAQAAEDADSLTGMYEENTRLLNELDEYHGKLESAEKDATAKAIKDGNRLFFLLDAVYAVIEHSIDNSGLAAIPVELRGNLVLAYNQWESNEYPMMNPAALQPKPGDPLPK